MSSALDAERVARTTRWNVILEAYVVVHATFVRIEDLLSCPARSASKWCTECRNAAAAWICACCILETECKLVGIILVVQVKVLLDTFAALGAHLFRWRGRADAEDHRQIIHSLSHTRDRTINT